MNWYQYSIKLWGFKWAIARKTTKNLERYGRCITRREYEAAREAWLKMYSGDDDRPTA